MPFRGEGHSPFQDTDGFYLQNNAAPPSGNLNPTGFHVNLPCTNREETIGC